MSAPTQFTGFLDLGQRLKVFVEQFKRMRQQLECDLRVSLPAVVKSFDSSKLTVSVQPTIKETLLVNAVPTPVSLPQFDDVPVMVYRAGGFSVTLPIQAGDECLLVFSDMCIDQWWQSGGVGNIQIVNRRHDLSDAIAIFGLSSQPRVLTGYSSSSLQVRSDDGTTVVEVANGGVVNIKANTVNLGQSPTDHLVLFETMKALFNSHTHTGVQTGAGTSGVPSPATQMGSTESTTNTLAS